MSLRLSDRVVLTQQFKLLTSSQRKQQIHVYMMHALIQFSNTASSTIQMASSLYTAQAKTTALPTKARNGGKV